MFDDRYEVFLADTLQAKNIHYSLRYQVYHVERGWEQGGAVLRCRLERDRYDAFSKHFLVRDRITHEWVGGMRLVVSPYHGLPLSRVCELDEGGEVAYDKSRCAEVSRLFVLPDYRCGRRREGDELLSQASRAGFGYYYEVMLGLIRAARMYGLSHGLASWYFLVEPGLARAIQRLGIDLQRCGPAVDHHGVRHPYYGEVANGFDRLFSVPSEVCEMFSQKEAYRLFSRSAIFRPRFDRISSAFIESRRTGLCVRF